MTKVAGTSGPIPSNNTMILNVRIYFGDTLRFSTYKNGIGQIFPDNQSIIALQPFLLAIKDNGRTHTDHVVAMTSKKIDIPVARIRYRYKRIISNLQRLR